MTALIDALANDPLFLGITTTLLGLVVGSFLNVVILRLPRMLEADWQAEARELLELAPVEAPKLSLTQPPSRCPGCGSAIRAWQNIPIVSWLLLRGRCASCKTAISMQYPLVELASALMSAVCVWRFGWSPQLAAALVLTWTLIALTVIDLRETILPDNMTLPLMWLGLGLSTVPVFVGMSASIWGAIVGYLSLWSIYHLFRIITGKHGMGYGDFKLMAGLGAWFGAMSLPILLLLSSAVGAVIGLGLIVFRGHDRNVPIPFGPYIAGAGWLMLIWGDALGGVTGAR
ncbi:A24 family peptidase [uncultured Nevskia sp.]|uniref:prepilin peptidase n=1 Tax=uncultured Nevskia sp. TaxID=228950 RepID=UPI0025E77D71|nr:A24 family peptidase [uncultured Nevskia sp.]